MAWDVFTGFTSSNIQSLRYDQGVLILEVGFLNGGLYQYFDVPPNVWTEFKAAPSQGKFLSERIKGFYRYSRV